MDVEEIQTEVLETTQANVTRYGPRIIPWIDKAQKIIARRTKYRGSQDEQSIATVGGTPTVDLPSNFSSIIALYNEDTDIPLIEIDQDEFDSRDDLTTGEPTRWVINNNSFLLTPTPDGIYNLKHRFWELPTTIDSSSVPLELSEEYHDLIVTFCSTRIYRSEEDYEAANQFMAEFERDLQKAANELNDSHAGPKQIRGTWYGWP